jgi:hypothetical protein
MKIDLQRRVPYYISDFFHRGVVEFSLVLALTKMNNGFCSFVRWRLTDALKIARVKGEF